MSKIDCADQVSDVMDLLSMLEVLVAGVSENEDADSEVPWAGILLTLRQGRGILDHVQQKLISRAQSSTSERTTVVVPRVERTSDMRAEVPVAGASLAERVQQVPFRAGRIRELPEMNAHVGLQSNGEARVQPQVRTLGKH